jgi:hypothetical protein
MCNYIYQEEQIINKFILIFRDRVRKTKGYYISQAF